MKQQHLLRCPRATFPQVLDHTFCFFFFAVCSLHLLKDEGSFIKEANCPHPQDEMGKIGAGCRYLEQEQPVGTLASAILAGTKSYGAPSTLVLNCC